MSYTPLTDAERAQMLASIGVDSVDELFADVPVSHRYPDIDLGPPRSEIEVLRDLRTLSEKNLSLERTISFLGAGAYQHFVPSLVGHILQRSEFYTAYTPYQPEISQGTLQATFEYQSMICALTGLEVANASHYDGATALAEAVLMAYNVGRGKRTGAVIAPNVHPEYRQVVQTYVQGTDIQLVGDRTVSADLTGLKAQITKDTCCVVIQNPGFLGELVALDEMAELVQATHQAKALLIVVGYPIALGLIQPPGAYDADIAVGEAQPLGTGLNYGGPYIGYFATRKKYVHKMAGRLVGQTTDIDGRQGYVLTLSAREQHIRRERATSNICTNQALCALASAVYLSTMGKSGLRQVAELCYHKAHYLAQQIDQLSDYSLVTGGAFFNEFVIRCPRPIRQINDALVTRGIVGGFDLGRVDSERADQMLLCATEVHSRESLDELVDALEDVA